MNISYNWLKDLIDLDLSADATAAALTRVGLAVEGIHPHGDDLVLDIDLTSNRPDCLSHLGVARELSVIADCGLRIADSSQGSNVANNSNLVSIESPDLCHRFAARIIRNVKVGPSPKWLSDRLEALGERSINNVADVTNYVMLELGQPMHAFDLDKLTENRIVVRRARKGERITTLKEIECELDDSVLAICDAEKPVAIGGVVGGLDSSITENTVNVLLEVAYFRRENIRATSRKLNLATEASNRFERGVDIENLIRASYRATELICELAGGEAGEFVDVYPEKFTPKQVESKDISSAVKRLTGLDVATDECKRILNSLGIISPEQSTIYVSPYWRHDIAIEEDLVEEVARHAGYENIADELPPAFHAGEYQPTESRKKLVRQTLADMGFDEAISYSFIDTGFDETYQTAPDLIDEKQQEQFVTLQDSVIEGALRMRPSILPGLLDAVRHNLNHQRRDVKLFEIGKVFATASSEDGLPNEQELLSFVLTGGETQEDRAMPVRELDFYDAKGALEAVLHGAGIENAEFSATDVKHLRRGQSASIQIGDTLIGYLGRLNDDIASTYKFKQPVFVAEINLQTVLSLDLAPLTYQPLARFPGITRDVSFIAPRTITFSAIRDAVAQENFELCQNIEFVDVYEGKGMEENMRSITIRLEYRSDERTLIEEEVEAVHQQILGQIEQKLSIKPRG